MRPQCDHKRTETVPIPTTGEQVDVCRDCGRTRLRYSSLAASSWDEPEGDHCVPLFKVGMAGDQSILTRTLRSGYIGEGERVKALEKALGNFTCEAAVATNSCTSAMELALDLIGICEDDEVISTPMTCLATNAPLARYGAQIHWADVDSSVGTILPESVRQILAARPCVKAIVTVDYAGRPCDYERLKEIAGDIPIIQDAAHRFDPRMVEGDYCVTSFQAIKFLTTGDGGALFPPSDRQLAEARLLRWFGLDREASPDFRCAQKPSLAGGKFHMNDIAASIGLANWETARNRVSTARVCASYYHEHLRLGKVLFIPTVVWSPWIYPILVEDRASFIEFMAANGVETSPVHCRNDDAPVHRFAETLVPLKGVDFFDEHQVCLPVGDWVTQEQRERIVRLVNSGDW